MSFAEDTLVAPIEAPAAVLQEFRAGFKAHAVMAMNRQEQINAASRRLENCSKLMDGIGQLKYRIDEDLYWHMRAIYGPDCWKDAAFTKALERDGVIQRVKGISDKIHISMKQGANLSNIKYKPATSAALTNVAQDSSPLLVAA